MKKIEDKLALIDRVKQRLTALKEEIRQVKKNRRDNLFEQSFADKLDYQDLKHEFKMTKILLSRLER